MLITMMYLCCIYVPHVFKYFYDLWNLPKFAYRLLFLQTHSEPSLSVYPSNTVYNLSHGDNLDIICNSSSQFMIWTFFATDAKQSLTSLNNNNKGQLPTKAFQFTSPTDKFQRHLSIKLADYTTNGIFQCQVCTASMTSYCA